MQIVEPTVVQQERRGGDDMMVIMLAALHGLRNGDASVRLPVTWTGTAGRVADCFNEIAERNERMANELSRLSLVVGKEGRLKQRCSLGEVGGFWRNSIESINELIDNLVHPTTETARVIGAVEQGDLSQMMALEIDERPLKGEFLRTAKTINKMVQQLSSFTSEVIRVAREVGIDGKLGGQARVKGLAGTWKDLTDNVNLMAGNLTAQVRNIAAVTTAVAKGDLSKKITVDVRGEILELKITINTMVDQLSSFASEVTRVAREVGTEGNLGGQAEVEGVAGIWKDLTDNVNQMANNLTDQVRNIDAVIAAVAKGDLTKKITVDVQGEILRLKNTINTMVGQLSSFASEVTRVAREVGTEGNLGGQAEVEGVAGIWKDLTDNVNLMANNLTNQVRNIADVTTAVANGDLSRKITVDVQGEILELKNTINTMVDQLSSFASEVTRVAREVGTEGKLGGQANVRGVAGTWKDLTDNVNLMANNLTSQVRNIADVTTAVANGDLSKKITVDVQGEILELKNTINTMVDQLNSFASEVTRVAREVGTEGKLGGQAHVRGVAGTWKDLTDSVNSMAGNLTSQVRGIADVTTAVANGDLSKKITVDVQGEILSLKNTINTMVDQLNSFASEVTRVAREVGTEGKLGGQANVRGVAGTWKDLTDNVNLMANNLTSQVRNIADVTTAVANGDLSKKITVDVQGEILELKNTINTMVDQLNSFASEVTRVAREVGTEGKLGGQANVRDVAGTWKDLTDSVNYMAGNLTSQVRGIAKVVSAVANGELRLKLTLMAKGEIEALAETINSMIDTLATFADQVTTVAREVGVEGKLGGQAKVPGAAGTWKALTENVNQLAANLTTQVRAIADVAVAVTQGDLTRSITVETQGEVAALKDTINEMIRNLRDSTQKNTEQDWLKTNLAEFGRMLQGQRDMTAVGRLILSELAPVVRAQQAEFYVLESITSTDRDEKILTLLASYGSNGQSALGKKIELGQGLVGQCAVDKQKIMLDSVPGKHLRISSGQVDAPPQNILVLPVEFEGQVKGVLELASLEKFTPTHHAFLDQLTEGIGIVLNTIQANMRTEDLLKQSQTLAQELQRRQEELQQTNEALQDKARLLAMQNQEVEHKNQEVEQARQELEEKAKQIALTSKYKSEFLANMSHELRTPLNTLLILSDQLSKNGDGNLTGRQMEFAKTIHSSGNDLLTLIDDILDLSKIESGTVMVEIGQVRLDELRRFVERTFRHVAESRNLDFVIELDPRLPDSICTSAKRLQQILRNLLSNAFKFTHRGRVTLTVQPVSSGWSPDNNDLNHVDKVIAFSVSDTGIGIPADKQQVIFEAFQQADGSTSRKYGGTGLGLAISRELSQLLGGEVRLVSTPDVGSTFTLYLPETHTPRPPRKVAEAVTTKAPEVAPNVNGQNGTAARNGSAPSRSTARDLPNESPARLLPNPVDDDRDDLMPGDRSVLIVENDVEFARILLESAREQGFKGLVTSHGTAALAMAHQYKPAVITLDLCLPDVDGWRVLDRLKSDLTVRHIPVCVISTEDARERALSAGALAFVAKPLQSKDIVDDVMDSLNRYASDASRKVLIIERNASTREELETTVRIEDVAVKAVADEASAERALCDQRYDCIIVGSSPSDFKASALADQIERGADIFPTPVLLCKGDDGDENDWRGREGIATVRRVRSSERLLDQALFFLHRDVAELDEQRRRIVEDLDQSNAMLAGKKVFIVDDDMRNIFALTTVLEEHNMVITFAEDGRSAIRILNEGADVDVILMDIMLPEMDGLDTMREIRKNPRLRGIPMIAVTAKAMKGDREKCIDAGAWDYVAKPVDVTLLLSVLRSWLRR